VTDDVQQAPGRSIPERNKHVVRRLVDDVLNGGRLQALDELYAPRLVPAARRWIEPFLASFSDIRMRVVGLIAEDDEVAGRFLCSGTHTGHWLGHAPTGRRFTDVAEVYFFRLDGGRIVRAWGLEDTASRLRQLGLDPSDPPRDAP
jgi:predicted ester cyclase